MTCACTSWTRACDDPWAVQVAHVDQHKQRGLDLTTKTRAGTVGGPSLSSDFVDVIDEDLEEDLQEEETAFASRSVWPTACRRCLAAVAAARRKPLESETIGQRCPRRQLAEVQADVGPVSPDTVFVRSLSIASVYSTCEDSCM